MPSAIVLGAGRLAAALVPGLAAAHWEVAGHARSAAGRARLRRMGARGHRLDDAGGFDLVFLAVPDGAVAEVARAIAPRLAAGQVIAHGAGALGLAPLAPALAAGAHPGSLHPVQALAGGPFTPGTIAAVDGDAPARRLLRRAARALGLAPIAVPAAGRVHYHAAAVITSNLALALYDMAREAWRRAGAPAAAADRALLPLLRGTVDNLVARGLPGALTGPAARGDAAVVARQLAALRGDSAEIYRLLSRRLVALAEGAGLPAARARAVRRALAPARPRRSR
jgi:predicted short-subunit dehydrogenase-like oxidoreductase (DUF2520 family)